MLGVEICSVCEHVYESRMPVCPACKERREREERMRRLRWRRLLFCSIGVHQDVAGGRFGVTVYECVACGREKVVKEPEEEEV